MDVAKNKKQLDEDADVAVAEADVEEQIDVQPEVVDSLKRILELGPDDSVPSDLLRLVQRWKRRVDFCSAGEVKGKDLITLVALYEHVSGDLGEELLPPRA